MNLIYCQSHLLSDHTYCYFLNFLSFHNQVLKSQRQTKNIKSNYDFYYNGQAGKAEWSFQELTSRFLAYRGYLSIPDYIQSKTWVALCFFVCSLFACYRLKWFTVKNRIPQHYYHTKKLYNQLCLRWLALLAFHSILFSKLLSSFSSPSFLWFSTNLVISKHVRSHWTKRLFQSFFFSSFIPNSPFPSPTENIRKPYGFRVSRG